MADITNAEVKKFSDDVLRPLCEKLRALDHEMQEASNRWTAVKTAAGLSNNSDSIQDGRDTEGVSRLVSSDIYNVMATIVPALEAVFATSWYRTYIAKPCVRPFVSQ